MVSYEHSERGGQLMRGSGGTVADNRVEIETNVRAGKDRGLMRGNSQWMVVVGGAEP